MKKLLLVCLSLFNLNIYANGCGGQFDPATGTCRIIGIDGKMVIYNSAPPQSPPHPPKKIIQYVDVYVPSKYGALAGEPRTGILRDFANADSLAEAKRKALDLCSQGGKIKGCRIYKWVRNGCISASGGKLNGVLKLFEAADVPGKAESTAMKRCQAVGTSNCRIVVPEVCSVPKGMYD